MKVHHFFKSQGLQAWHHRHDDLSRMMQAWKRLTYLLIVMLILSWAYLIYIHQTRQIKVFCIEMCDKRPMGLVEAKSFQRADDLYAYFLRQFIIRSRSIEPNISRIKQNLDYVYAYSADETLRTLRDYYNEHHPLLAAQNKQWTKVDHVRAFKLSPHIWEIYWDEWSETSHGIRKKQKYFAELSVHMGHVRQEFIQDNPLGLYVTKLNWGFAHES